MQTDGSRAPALAVCPTGQKKRRHIMLSDYVAPISKIYARDILLMVWEEMDK